MPRLLPLSRLQQNAAQVSRPLSAPLEVPAPVFLFSGEGSQWSHMASALLKAEPVFRMSVAECDALFHTPLGFSVRECLERGLSDEALDDVRIVHPCLCTMQVGLAALWQSRGLEPGAVVGHSIGEVAAAHVAGALSLSDAVTVLSQQALLLAETAGRGGMVLVRHTLAETEHLLEDFPGLHIAVQHAPRVTVVAGERAALEAFVARQKASGVFCRWVNTAIAPHGPTVGGLAERLFHRLSGIAPGQTHYPFHSTVSGKLEPGERLDASYWVRNLTCPVLLAPVLERLVEAGHRTFLELSPDPVLLSALRQVADGCAEPVALLPSLRKRGGALETLQATTHQLEALGLLRAQENPASTETIDSQATEVPSVSGLARQVQLWVAEVVGARSPEALPLDRPLAELGLDSLLALELRDRLQPLTRHPLPPTLAFDFPTVHALTRHLLRLNAAGDAPVVDRPASVGKDEPIAIVGMACRLPGAADSLENYWKLLSSGVDAVSEVPPERWSWETFYDPDPEAEGKTYSRWGGFLPAIEDFDPGFFNIAPREAQSLDPQQRLLLEVSVEALEVAGIQPSMLEGSQTGVYVGISNHDYGERLRSGEQPDAYLLTGTGAAVSAGRLAYTFGLQGPTLAVDTACSSSLVAIHEACTALRTGQCDLALAGGVNLVLSPVTAIALSRFRALSPTGRCHAFSAEADGFVRSEGCGMVVLKPLSRALSDGDRVWAVLRGTAINQDGRSNGLTAPNGPAQEAVVRMALERSQLEPSDIDYVECHGTGTKLGDPIEVNALGAVYGQGRDTSTPLLLGAVKSNLGHTEAAAGVAGLIKTVLALQQETLPKSLHCDTLNPLIPWSELPVEVVQEARPWPRGARPRRAGVSSFGLSGTNAHVIVEEAAPPVERSHDASPVARPAHLLVLSGRTPEAVTALAGRYAEHLTHHPELALDDICHSAAATRTAFSERLAVVAPTREQLVARLRTLAREEDSDGAVQAYAGTERPKVAFLFSGQGSQYIGMGRQLFETEPVFRQAIEQCAGALAPHLERPLLEVLYPGEGESSPLDETVYTQPALFAHQWALYTLWRSWGIEPDVVMGHSVGEYVAACIAGVFSWEDALTLLAARGRLMQALAVRGSMLAVEAPLEAVASWLVAHEGRVSVAAENAPGQVVVSGDETRLEELAQKLLAEGIQARRLKVSHAFHSPLMRPMLAEFRVIAERVTFGLPQRALISNVSGELAGVEVATPDYWVQHVEAPVRFQRGMESLAQEGIDCFVELGGHATLLPLGQRCLPESTALWTASLHRNRADVETLLLSLGALWTRGLPVDWQAFAGPHARTRVSLPTYPFQRKRYWIEATANKTTTPGELAEAQEEVLPSLFVREWVDSPAVEQQPLTGRWTVLGTSILATALRDHLGKTVPLESGDWDGCVVVDEGSFIHEVESGTTVVADTTARLQLLQDILRAVGDRSVQVVWVTRLALNTGRESSTDLNTSALAGLLRVARLEHPLLKFQQVDLDLETPFEQLVTVLGERPEAEEVVLRSGSRLLPRLVPVTAQAAPPAVESSGLYLITGGLGALGLHTARLLVRQGARQLLLLGRSAPSEQAQQSIAELEREGCRIITTQVDIADRDALAAVLEAASTAHPLRGIFHTAGVLDDGLLLEQTPERLAHVMRGKVLGAWNLHELTQHLPLEHFVLYSSMAGAVGNPGQANYAAANTWLDGLAAWRRQQGLPGLSIAWGGWAGGGLLDQVPEAHRLRMDRGALPPLDPEEGTALLRQALSLESPQVLAFKLRKRVAASAEEAVPALLEPVVRVPSTSPRPARSHNELASTLQGLTGPAREAAVLTRVREQVARVLGMASATEVPETRPLKELGLDSLMAVELRNRLSKLVGKNLPSTIAFDHPTVALQGRYLLEKVLSGELSNSQKRPPSPVRVTREEPIAIIGLACRFPGAVLDPTSYWKLLREGRDAITEIPDTRWHVDDYYDPTPGTPGKMVTRWGGFIAEVDQFEPELFGISPREALFMDPQQRLLLEVTRDALEAAGYAPETLQGTGAGVYVGMCATDYAQLILDAGLTDTYRSTGNLISIAAGRLAYTFGLQGPALAIDTACSSSLVAVHQACQALRTGECEVALAGGVSLILSPQGTLDLSGLQALSPTGRCHAFSAEADGFVRSEGCGMVVLKPLSRALSDGDRVWAVLRGTAINQDGRSNGLTAPNGPAQEAVVRMALERSQLEHSDIDYVECHGTGTKLGDPIEVNALGSVYGRRRDTSTPLLLGTVKSNLGHTEAAAGVAGLIKTVLALQHETLPKSLHCQTLNPLIPWSELPVEVVRETRPWPRGARPRRAGVSSFGLSGTNAHVIVEEAPVQPDARPEASVVERPAHLLVLSGRTPEAVTVLAGRYAEHLSHHPELALDDFCHAAAVTRTAFSERMAVVAPDREQLVACLRTLARGEDADGAVQASAGRERPKVAFLFSGQGSQYIGMGRQLFETEPVFRQAMEQCAGALDPHLERPLLEVLYPTEGESSPLDETVYTQPALFAHQWALYTLWRSWGIEPDVVMGHSVGEYVAACVAGVFSWEDALRLIAARGRLMQALAVRGSMLAVEAPLEAVASWRVAHEGWVSVAAENAPGQVVLSGDETRLEELTQKLLAEGIQSRRLKVSHAFHSPLMRPMLEEFRAVAERVTFRIPQRPLISNVSGELAGVEVATPDYWVQHVEAPVRFQRGMESLAKQGIDCFVELGGHATLLPLGQRCLPESTALWTASLHRSRAGVETLLLSLGALWTRGLPVDWQAFAGPHARTRVSLPTYPFQRKRYWIEATARPLLPGTGPVLHPLLGGRLPLAGTQEVYQSVLSLAGLPWLEDHQVLGRVVLPAAAWLELAFAAGCAHFGGEACVEGVVIERPLVLEGAAGTHLQVVVSPESDDEASFTLFARRATPTHGSTLEQPWQSHVSGRLVRGTGVLAPQQAGSPLSSWQARCTAPVSASDHYERMSARGLEYGPCFQGVVEAWRGQHETLGFVRLNEDLAEEASHYRLHPALLDAAFQVMEAHSAGEPQTLLPFSVERLEVYAPAGRELWVHHALGHGDASTGQRSDITLLRPDGTLVAHLWGMALRPVKPESLEAEATATGIPSLFVREWVEAPVVEQQPLTGRWTVLGTSTLAADFRSRLTETEPLESGDWDGCVVVDEEITDSTAQAGSGATLVDETSRRLCQLQAVIRAAGERQVRILWVTREALFIGDEQQPSLNTSAIAGLLRVATLEFPHLTFQQVDLDLNMTPEHVHAALVNELAIPPVEQEIVWRRTVRKTPRLASQIHSVAATTLSASNYELRLVEQGSLDGVLPVSVQAPDPGPGQVTVRVRHVGLNFKEALIALGMLEADSLTIGREVAGEVEQVGEGVDTFSPGERVVSLPLHSAQRLTVIDARWLLRLPANLSSQTAATLPVNWLTAWYALHEVARIRPGDRVLIHAAAGGTGWAAVQLAFQAGAEVFATASPEKWPVLQAAGVRHLASSRTPGFGAAFRETSGGHGMDVIVNSLTGAMLAESLKLLAPEGRFVELGKREILAPTERADLPEHSQYQAIDLVEVEPQRQRTWLERIVEGVANGELKAAPCQTYPISQVQEGLRALAQGKSVGKVVLELPPGFSAHGLYLITGGLGALGLHAARLLVRQGARHLLLLGRSAPSEQALQSIAELEREGCRITITQVDIAERDALAAVLEAASTAHPLRGIFHTAGVLDDGLLLEQTPQRLAHVMRGKVLGAWNLHQLTQHLPLEHFVLYSSMAGALGNPGQANYAAANAWLDGLAAWRRQQGLPGLSIAWGGWAGGGLLNQVPEAHRLRMDRGALPPLEPEEGTALLRQALTLEIPQVLAFKLRKQAATSAEMAVPALLEPLVRMPSTSPRPARAHHELASTLRGLTGPAREAAVLTRVREQVARVLGMASATEVPETRPLKELGLDSLMAVELRNRLSKLVGKNLPSTLAFDYPTPALQTRYLLEKVLPQDTQGELRPSKSWTVAAVTEQALDPCLLVLRSTGVRPPLLLVPGLEAGAEPLLQLTHTLDESQPVFSFTLPDPADSTSLSSSTEALVERFARAILRARVDETFHVVGHGTGGVLAFELVRQLEAAGRRVLLLQVIEPWTSPWGERSAALEPAPLETLEARVCQQLRHGLNGAPSEEALEQRLELASLLSLQLTAYQRAMRLRRTQVTAPLRVVQVVNGSALSGISTLQTERSGWKGGLTSGWSRVSRRGCQVEQESVRLCSVREPAHLNALAQGIQTACRSYEADEEVLAWRLEPVTAPTSLEAERLLLVSRGQQRFWLLEQLRPGSQVYHNLLAVRLTGVLVVEALEGALRVLLERHETLRSCFEEADGQLHRRLRPAYSPWLPPRVLESDTPTAIDQALQALAEQPFDLSTGVLLRSQRATTPAGTQLLLLCLHHITFDGWSMNVLLGELAGLYQSQLQPGPGLPPPGWHYADFVAWEQRWLASPQAAFAHTFWSQQLEGLPPLELPTTRSRPGTRTSAGAHLTFTIPDAVVTQLDRLALREGCSRYVVLLAAYAILLHRYSGQTDFGIGTVAANRIRPELAEVFGYFVNTVVLRCRPEDLTDVETLLRNLHQRVDQTLRYQALPYEALVSAAGAHSSGDQLDPLIQACLVYENMKVEAAEGGGVSWAYELLSAGGNVADTAKFDLTLTFMPQRGSLLGELEYSTDLFDQDAMQRLIGHYQTLLEGMMAHPQTRLSELPLLTQGEEEQLRAWNDTAADFPVSTIHALFEAQVERSPEAVAVVFEGAQLTYAELNCRANQLAHHLRALGVGPEVRVGICLERSLELIVALLGVLKAGGAYVPLDPDYPQERLRYMLEDSGVPVVVTMEALQARVAHAGVMPVCLDVSAQALGARLDSTPESGVIPENLAYVIYTSGSTGRPKGVAIPHRNVCSLQQAQRLLFNTHPSERVLQFASSAFDAMVSELFTTFLSGATLVCASNETLRDPLALTQCFVHEDITTATLPPAMLLQLEPALLPLKMVISAGESCSALLAERWSRRSTFINAYGPTEATVCASAYVYEESTSGPPPIGKPIANTALYVLDGALHPLPPGIPGELYIGGVQVARGYLNRPGLTAERFLPDPFGPPGSRMYRTGDLCRFREDGNLEYLGRIDHQIKLRGFRIELGEIEAALLEQPGVAQAVVVAREDSPGHKRLVAYVISTSERGDVNTLRAVLSQRLPDYMVPSAFVSLEAFPLTPNGKLDRKALPAPELHASPAEQPQPRSPTEELVASLFAQVLHLETVPLASSFFELGGHSLLATQLMSRVRATFGRELPLRTLFERPTVTRLAAQLERAQGEGLPMLSPIRPRESSAFLPLSFSQQRMWFLEQLEPGKALYHIPIVLRLKGKLELAALRTALEALLARHEALRTAFRSQGGEAHQVIVSEVSLELPLVDLRELPEPVREDEARRLAEAEALVPFQLEQAPLLRAQVLQLEEACFWLLLTLHHIVSDGWSMGILFNELAACYHAALTGEAPELAPLPVQYADYALWQRAWLTGEPLETLQRYWKQALADVPPLELPTDFARPVIQSSEGAHETFELSETLTRQLHVLSRQAGVTLFMTLLAGLEVLLSRYSGQVDFAIGTPIANRLQQEVEGLIGCFINTLVLRARLDPGQSVEALLHRVRETTLGAYAHQLLPFEQVVELLEVERDQSRSPLFQVLFVLQNAGAGELSLDGLEVTPEGLSYPVAKFDLTVSLEERNGKLHGIVEYSTKLFTPERIQRLIGHYQTLLEGMVAHPQARLSELTLLTQGEREQLRAWNDTAADFPVSTIHALFEAQVERSPEAVAVVFEGAQLTYAELNCRANQLAHHLRALGVGPEVRVGICLERSLELIVALLGVLKAGGAYVPLDPDYPQDRLRYMLEDSGVPVVVTMEALQARVAHAGVRPVCLDALASALEVLPPSTPESGVTPDNLAYVIYTSGSTGRPKGTLIPHDGAANLLLSMAGVLSTSPQDVILAVTTFAFDIAALELFLPLLTGARVVIASLACVRDGGALRSYLKQTEATLMQATPATWRMLLDAGWTGLPGLRLLCGGELLRSELARELLSRCDALWNVYGPTETTIWSSLWKVNLDAEANVSIGHPLDNNRLYVLDGALHPLPPGIPGELYIGGVQVARGYLNRPGLTAERFLPDPFGPPGSRMYRTGDLCRFREDGNFEYLGRIDHQIKLRGFRIELGEIEAAMLEQPGVSQAVVVAREDSPGHKRLVAYVIPTSELGDVNTLRAALSQRLPDYMVPSAIVCLESFPLTPNGKLDRKALPAPEASPLSGTDFVPPSNRTEVLLVQLWEELLGLQPIGVTHSFFELGGHSLLAVQLVSRINARFGVALSVAEVFRAPTIAAFAARLQAASSGQTPSPLVPLRTTGSRSPLFFVHPASGMAHIFASLVECLPADLPFYGLQAQGLEQAILPHATVEEMAAAYLLALREVQPHGPYRLGGLSFGGIVAFEMAQQLLAEGETVSYLGMLDSGVPGFVAADSSSAEDEQTSLLELLAVEQNLSWRPPPGGTVTREQGLHAMSDELAQRLAVSAAEAAAYLERLFGMFEHLGALAKCYVPRPYAGRLHFIRALGDLPSEGSPERALAEGDPTLGWRHVAADIRVQTSPAHHTGLIHPPFVAQVAELLQEQLDDASRRSE